MDDFSSSFDFAPFTGGSTTNPDVDVCSDPSAGDVPV